MKRDEFNQGLCAFLSASPTPFHAVATMAAALEAGGFGRLREDESWSLQAGGRYYLTRNDSSIIAFIVGTQSPPDAGMRMVGAHTDSPCLMVKPEPEVYRNGYLQLGVQVYGGALLNPWFDRDLSMAGRVSYQCEQGALHSTLVDFRDPLAYIPSLAIHLDREANSKRSVNAQRHLLPILALRDADSDPRLRALLHERIEAQNAVPKPDRVLDYELSLYDSQPPAIVGLDGDFVASARLDNLLSCYTGMQALLRSDDSHSALLVCNDHEEVGSLSASGAQGPFLRQVLQRLAGGDEELARITGRSLMISADNAHGVHPNFADKHDENHGPLLNGGPVIKINASQRYATNSETSALFRMLCADEEVPVQSFVVRSDMACGSTIGPITAGVTGIRTLDIGVPTFAMHSIRELAGSADAHNLCRVLARFYTHSGPLRAT